MKLKPNQPHYSKKKSREERARGTFRGGAGRGSARRKLRAQLGAAFFIFFFAPEKRARRLTPDRGGKSYTLWERGPRDVRRL